MILIIAYGNPLREDDGAGLVLAEKLETLLRRLAIETRRVEMQQLLPELAAEIAACLLYTSPSPRDRTRSRMPSSA